MTVRTSELRTLGLRTRVLEAGADGDEAVVFIHGGPGCANDWLFHLEQAAEVGRALAFDLPGFGEAEKPRHLPYSGPTWATFIQGALNRLGVRRAHLVLHDLGGDAGLHWAAIHPDAVESVVLVNTGALIGYRWHAIAKLSRTPGIRRLAILAGGVGLRPVMRLYEPGLPKEVIRRWRREYGRGTRRAMDRFYRSAPAVVESGLVPELRALDRPALVIWGERNRFIPVKHAEDQLQSFPRAEVVVLPDCGHYAQLERPQRVSELILPFLERQLSNR